MHSPIEPSQGMRRETIASLAVKLNGAVALHQRGELEAGWCGPAIKDMTGEIDEFADTAALIELLDLVISVDTSTTHLAAASGSPPGPARLDIP